MRASYTTSNCGRIRRLAARSLLAASLLVTGTSADASDGTDDPVSRFGLNFVNLAGAGIEFDGSSDTFRFRPDDGLNQFVITSTTGLGDALNLRGRMEGVFAIGPISSFGISQTAPVNGLGTLVIHDGAGQDLTAALVWDEISTLGNGGILNVNGVVNLSSVRYGGTVADLAALAQPGAALEAITFQFVPGATLHQLTMDGSVRTTSFSGNFSVLTPVPEPGVAALGLALALAGIAARIQNKARLHLRSFLHLRSALNLRGTPPKQGASWYR